MDSLRLIYSDHYLSKSQFSFLRGRLMHPHYPFYRICSSATMKRSPCILTTSMAHSGRVKESDKMAGAFDPQRNEASIAHEGTATAPKSRRSEDMSCNIVGVPPVVNGASQFKTGSVDGITLSSTDQLDVTRNVNGAAVISESTSANMHSVTSATLLGNYRLEDSQERIKEKQENGAAGFIEAKYKYMQSSSNEDILHTDFSSETKLIYPEVVDNGGEKGLGIVDFLYGKRILITGATGFLAKVLVEKILRVQPDVGNLYLLIKAQNLDCAKRRLEKEIINAEVFMKLRSRYGNGYNEFMMERLTPVVGDITQENLGIEVNTMRELANKLHVIVNSAANTTFDERYDVALKTNTKGPQRVLELGKRCPHLQLFLHVSTAFANGQRQGLVAEVPFNMGQSVAREIFGMHSVPDLSIEAEFDLLERSIDENCPTADETASCFPEELGVLLKKIVRKKKDVTQLMKQVGLERAKMFGWQDTYVFTKAMGEMLINKFRGQTPVVILRPSVIESSYQEPFAGWMEGNRMMDPILIAYGKGQLAGFVADPFGVLDVVPVDMVANAMLATMAKHSGKPGLEVYQVASSVVNPLVMDDLARISFEHFTELPYVDKAGNTVKPERMNFFQNMESLMTFACENYRLNKSIPCSGSGNLTKRESLVLLKSIEHASYLAKIYKPYTFYAGRFDNSNTEKLYRELSAHERETFRFDVREIDWEKYIKHIHIPGLRKHVMKETHVDF